MNVSINNLHIYDSMHGSNVYFCQL